MRVTLRWHKDVEQGRQARALQRAVLICCMHEDMLGTDNIFVALHAVGMLSRGVKHLVIPGTTQSGHSEFLHPLPCSVPASVMLTLKLRGAKIKALPQYFEAVIFTGTSDWLHAHYTLAHQSGAALTPQANAGLADCFGHAPPPLFVPLTPASLPKMGMVIIRF